MQKILVSFTCWFDLRFEFPLGGLVLAKCGVAWSISSDCVIYLNSLLSCQMFAVLCPELTALLSQEYGIQICFSCESYIWQSPKKSIKNNSQEKVTFCLSGVFSVTSRIEYCILRMTNIGVTGLRKVNIPMPSAADLRPLTPGSAGMVGDHTHSGGRWRMDPAPLSILSL